MGICCETVYLYGSHAKGTAGWIEYFKGGPNIRFFAPAIEAVM